MNNIRRRFSIWAAMSALLAVAAVAIFTGNAAAQSDIDYDTDDDRLIEVANLSQFNAIRWDLDGNGLVSDSVRAGYTSAFPNAVSGMGCPSNGCSGYELTTDLDFDTNNDGRTDIAGDTHWNGGLGWDPIGNHNHAFQTRLDGNGYKIRNLFSNRPTEDDVGLLGFTAIPARLLDIELVDADVTGGTDVGALVGQDHGNTWDVRASGTVNGSLNVGGLVGLNYGDLTRAYFSGSVDTDGSVVGGLVGSAFNSTIKLSGSSGSVSGDRWVGGLLGSSNGGNVEFSYSTSSVEGNRTIGGLIGESVLWVKHSYALGEVTATGNEVGGLVGQISGGNVSNSYARGDVSGSSRVGGLVGYVYSSPVSRPIKNSYALGRVSGNGDTGGLLGAKRAGASGNCDGSYWDTETSNSSSSACGGGRTTAQLSGPTGATGIYSGWDSDHWDFGNGAQYPGLTADWDDDGNATVREFGAQFRLALPWAAQKPQDAFTDVTSDVLSGWSRIRFRIPEEDGVSAALYRIAYSSYEGGTRCGGWGSAGPDYLRGASVVSLASGPGAVEVSDAQEDGSYFMLLDHALLGIDPGSKYCIDISPANYRGSGPTERLRFLSVPHMVDYDTDDDGHIEISNLEQLNAIRWDLNGDGAVGMDDRHSYEEAFRNAVGGMGCPASGCQGYELIADLDFDTNGNGEADAGDDYWNDGEGWEPIGGLTRDWEDSGPAYRSNLRGNGHVIRNLYVNRPADWNVGLFGHVDGGLISYIGLEDAWVTGKSRIGIIAGSSDSTIRYSFATGRAAGAQEVSHLPRERSPGYAVGGLVGVNTRLIHRSYAGVYASGADFVGGMVGVIHDYGRVEDAYATGRVTAFRYGAGGLAGYIKNVHSTLLNAYSIGPVDARYGAGGLAGEAWRYATCHRNYWDTQTSGQPDGDCGSGKTTEELTAPTGATGIYDGWDSRQWDFGDDNHYPALKVDFNGDGTATWDEFGHQRSYVDMDRDGLIDVENRDQLNAIRWDLNGDGRPESNADDYMDAFVGSHTGLPVICVGVPCHGYELTSDVNLNQESWMPIGNLASGKWDATFRGNGHTISHLKVKSTVGHNVGLFGETTHRSVIEGVHIYSADAESYGGNNDDNRQNSAGALVGFNRGIVRESGLSYIWGDICKISGRNVSGGLVGGNEGIVERSWSNCDDINSKKAGGGLVGFNHPGGIVRDSWADGLVIVKRKGWKKGALIGRNFGTVERSFSLGQTRRDKTYHGPLTGQQGGVVTDSYFVGHGYDEKYGGEHLKDEDMRTPRASHPGFFADWDRQLWHLGDRNTYSALVVDANHDGIATPWEMGPQRPSDSVNGKPVKVGDPAITRTKLTLQFRAPDGNTAALAAVHYRIAARGWSCTKWFGSSTVLLGRSDERATLTVTDDGLYTLEIDRLSDEAFQSQGRVCVDVNFLNTEGKGYRSSQRWRDIHMPAMTPVSSFHFSAPPKYLDSVIEMELTLNPGNAEFSEIDGFYKSFKDEHGNNCHNPAYSYEGIGPEEVLRGSDADDGVVKIWIPYAGVPGNRAYCLYVQAWNEDGTERVRRWTKVGVPDY